MHVQSRRMYGLILIMAIAPGCIIPIYSQTYIQSGIGATTFMWQRFTGVFHPEVVLNVSSENQIATKTIRGQRIRVPSFNTSDHEVSIEIRSQLNGTILNHSSVSGQEIEGIIFPAADPPTGWVQDQNYTILVFWEGVNTSVIFDYYFDSVAHGDGAVYFTLPGYYETQNLGFTFLGIGIAISIVFAIVVLKKRNGSR